MTNSKPILLDGGMGQELLHRGASGDGTLWSGWALSEDLSAVREVHRDFAAAGADVLTTNTYTTTRPRLARNGMEDRFIELNEIGAAVCREVADEFTGQVRVAGCLPPQFASYQVDLPVSESELVELYSEQAGIVAPFCDLLIAETLSSAMECRSAVEGARSAGLPIWLACTLGDNGADTLRSGETLELLLAEIENQMPDAILFNCTSPESVTAALTIISRYTDVAVGGYANGFTHVPEGWRIVDDASLPDQRLDLDPAAYARHANNWLANGASIIGGCCEIGPGHIAVLRALIDSDY